MAEEQVAIFLPSDGDGRPTGSAPRSVMRRDNLRHASTAIVVTDVLHRIYAHRRTATKDVYPSYWDLAAGGVLAAGEDPAVCAVRELAEELGIDGDSAPAGSFPLEPIGAFDFADEHIRCRAYCFLVSGYSAGTHGPIRHQASEVAEGAWLSLEQVLAMIDDPAVPVMPDSASILGPWLAEQLASERAAVSEPAQGWDSFTSIVGERWVDRRPRRPEVAEALRAEVNLMSALAGQLPLQVPQPVVMQDEPLRVRHLLVPGEPVDVAALTALDGEKLGQFLRALHDADLGQIEARDLGVGLRADLARMRARVLPLLPADRLSAGTGLLDRADAYCAGAVTPVPIHSDLGPLHLLTEEGRLSGVIDWTDSGLGDPARDLAWVLHGTPTPFAQAVIAAYRPTAAELARAADWHALGPWWEVLAGLDDLVGDQADLVASGLAGVLDRL